MLICMLRTLVLYVVIVVCVRLMGKRQVGELQNSELVITLLVSELAAIPMQEPGIPLLSGVVPILTLVACELAVSALMMKSGAFRRIMCGSPVAVIRHGQLLPAQLRRLRMTVEDLTESLRMQGVFDLSEVEFAAVETSGQLSVQKKAACAPPDAQTLGVRAQNSFAAVVWCEGQFCPHSAALIGCSRAWVTAAMAAAGCAARDVLFVSADAQGRYTVMRRDGRFHSGQRSRGGPA